MLATFASPTEAVPEKSNLDWLVNRTSKVCLIKNCENSRSLNRSINPYLVYSNSGSIKAWIFISWEVEMGGEANRDLAFRVICRVPWLVVMGWASSWESFCFCRYSSFIYSSDKVRFSQVLGYVTWSLVFPFPTSSQFWSEPYRSYIYLWDD